MDTFNLSLSPTPPRSSILTTAANLTQATGVEDVTVGLSNRSVPRWVCGVKLTAECPCLPAIWPSNAICGSAIAENKPTWEPLTGDPLVDIKYPADSGDGCCVFLPLTQNMSKERFRDCGTPDEVQRLAAESLEAFSHYWIAKNLVEGFNGNPSLSSESVDVGPASGAKVDICSGLSILQERSLNQGGLVASQTAANWLTQSGLIYKSGNGNLLTTVGDVPVITGPGLTGSVGPGGAAADPGCEWLYMTSGVWAGVESAVPIIDNDRPAEDQIRGNLTGYTTEVRGLAVFNKCDVYAVLVNTNKGNPC